MVEKVYYESDFALAVRLPDGVGGNDFELEAYTDGRRVIKFYRYAGKLSTNLIKDDKGRLLALFRDHGLAHGKLQARFNYSRDGLTQVAKWYTNIELTPIAIDASTIPTLDLVGYITQGGGGDSGDSGGGSGDNGDNGDSKPQTPADFAIDVSPVGNITAEQLNVTTITSVYPIASYDLANVRYKKQFGNVWFDTVGEATLSSDKKVLKLTWNVVADNYPTGTALTLEIPAGAIVADNGAKNLEFTAGVTIL